MARLLAALPRSFARFTDGAAGARRRPSPTGAAIERRSVAAMLAAGRRAAAAPAVSAFEPAAEDPALAEELRRGPGWFDSSWELRSGLEVREGLPADLGVNEWLEAFCGAGQVAVA